MPSHPKKPQSLLRIAAYIYGAKAGLEPARAWPTTPSSSACYFPQHIKITQLFEILMKIGCVIFYIFSNFLLPFFRQNQSAIYSKKACAQQHPAHDLILNHRGV